MSKLKKPIAAEQDKRSALLAKAAELGIAPIDDKGQELVRIDPARGGGWIIAYKGDWIDVALRRSEAARKAAATRRARAMAQLGTEPLTATFARLVRRTGISGR